MSRADPSVPSSHSASPRPSSPPMAAHEDQPACIDHLPDTTLQVRWQLQQRGARATRYVHIVWVTAIANQASMSPGMNVWIHMDRPADRYWGLRSALSAGPCSKHPARIKWVSQAPWTVCVQPLALPYFSLPLTSKPGRRRRDPAVHEASRLRCNVGNCHLSRSSYLI